MSRKILIATIDGGGIDYIQAAEPISTTGYTRAMVDINLREAHRDGVSSRSLLTGQTPTGWRNEAHWEIDFRDINHGIPEKALDIHLNECCLNVIRDENYKYVHFAALPPKRILSWNRTI